LEAVTIQEGERVGVTAGSHQFSEKDLGREVLGAGQRYNSSCFATGGKDMAEKSVKIGCDAWYRQQQ